MRRNHRRWGPRTLAYWLGQDGIDPVPARSTIYRVLVRNHLIVPVPRKRKRDSYVRWERDASMELWQHDFISGVWLKSGRELKVVTGIDDHSRYCVLAKVVNRASGRQICLAFAQAMSTYGIPDEVLSDNGTQFTNRLIKRKTMGEVALRADLSGERHRPALHQGGQPDDDGQDRTPAPDHARDARRPRSLRRHRRGPGGLRLLASRIQRAQAASVLGHGHSGQPLRASPRDRRRSGAARRATHRRR